MKQITLSQYEALHPDKRSVWTTERTDQKDWEKTRHLYIGKRTMLDYDDKHGTVLLIEGLSLNIIDDRKPSPAPWELQNLGTYSKDYLGSKTTYCIRDAANHCLAVVGEVDGATSPHNEANAKLMVAAPELLAACERVLSSLNHNLADDCLPETKEALRAAIAKAKGE